MTNIRDEMWLKLWGNLCFNPISALTHATLDVIATDPDTRARGTRDDDRGRDHRARLGVNFRVDVERRINGAGRWAPIKTSMLQDLERDRPWRSIPW